MIQRKQTLYLFAGFIFQLLTAIYAAQIQYQNDTLLNAFTYHFTSSSIGLLILISVFLYKKRPLQRMICLLASLGLLFIVALGIFGMIRTGFYMQRDLLFVADLVSVVCLGMAYSGIKKDEALVRSVDRIR